jgi:hypothetical protein
MPGIVVCTLDYMPQIRHFFDVAEEGDDLPQCQRIRPIGKRKSIGGPKKSSKGGLPKSVIKVLERCKRKGNKNEERFFKFAEEFKSRLSRLISHFERPTTHDDEVLKVDAWCVLKNQARLKIQIKSSCKRAQKFRSKYATQDIIVLVINDYKTTESIFFEFSKFFDVVARRLKLL